MEKALLSTAYLPPVQYFTKIISYPQVFIEKKEHFLKQSYRNRCVILGPNGSQSLFVPVTQGRSGHVPITDIRIAYQEQWQKQHWRSLVTAYNSSPFFEYYRDALEPFFMNEKGWTFLFDFNYELITTILNEIGINKEISFTSDYQSTPEADTRDFRNRIHPKSSQQKEDPEFLPIPYTQVFQSSDNFAPNLSIIDLLMNTGPDTLQYLQQSTKII